MPQVTNGQIIALAVKIPPTPKPLTVLIQMVQQKYGLTPNVAGGAVRRCIERGGITQKWELTGQDDPPMLCQWVEPDYQTDVVQIGV